MSELLSKFHETIKKKRWATLSQLRDFIECGKTEKVVWFNGAVLETNKARYGLFDSNVRVEILPKPKALPDQPSIKKITKKKTK